MSPTDIQLGTTNGGEQETPSLVALSTGGFAAAWAESSAGNITLAKTMDYRSRVIDAAGVATGPELLLAANTFGRNPSLTALGSGAFAVAWRKATDFSTTGLLVRIVDSSGAFTSPETLLPTTSFVVGSTPRLTTLASGRLFASWTIGTGVVGEASNVRARVLDAKADFISVDATSGGACFVPAP